MPGSGDRQENSKSQHGWGGSFSQRVLMAIVLVAIVVGLILLFWFTAHVWLVLFAGFLLGIFLSTLANFVSRRTKWAHGWSLTVVIIFLLAIASFAGWLMADPLAYQFQQLTQQLPQAWERLRVYLEQFEWIRFVLSKVPTASAATAEGTNVIGGIAQFFTGTVNVISSFFIIIFFGLYLAFTPQFYAGGLLYLFPIRQRPQVATVFNEVTTTLKYWLLGQILSMAFVGTFIGIGLKLLGVPLPLALGILTGLLDFIPIVGPILSAAPAVLLAFVQSPMQAVYVILLYVVVFFIESHLIIPLVHVYTISLPPALSIFALFIMAELFGFLGVLLATPIFATLLVLIKSVYIERVLGDTSVAPLAGLARRSLIQRRRRPT